MPGLGFRVLYVGMYFHIYSCSDISMYESRSSLLWSRVVLPHWFVASVYTRVTEATIGSTLFLQLLEEGDSTSRQGILEISTWV